MGLQGRIPTGLPVVQRKTMSPSVFTEVPFDLTAGLDMLDARILNLHKHTQKNMLKKVIHPNPLS